MASIEEKFQKLSDRVQELAEAIQGLQTKINEREMTSSSSLAKLVEKAIQKSIDPTFYQDPPTLDPNLSSKLPKNFSAEDIPKFKPTDDPRFHLKGFKTMMSLKGIDPTRFPMVFPLSLEPICQKWFFSLPEKDTVTWEEIAHAFMTRYKGNIQSQTSFRELEILMQEEKKGFTAYLSRWRGVAATLVSAPTEEEMVKTFIYGLQPKYKDYLKYRGLTTFTKVYDIGIAIGDDLLKETTKGSNWVS